MKLLNWLNSIDNKLFSGILLLMIIGFIMTMAASPAIAERISVNHFYFIDKQLIYLTLSIFVLITLSGLNEQSVKKFIFYGFVFTLIMLLVVLILGDATKGAKRWLNFFGFSLQPSEFLKPFYSAMVAMILARITPYNRSQFFLLLIGFHSCLMILLLAQPDFGMAILISTIFCIQLFISGMPMLWLFMLSCVFLVSAILVYYIFPHVAKRVEKFLSAADGEVSYQVQKSLESYASGGLFGKGPGEGIIKYQLPDAHTDFIFPVITEELGAIFSILVICLMIFIVIRSFLNLLKIRYSLYRVYCGTAIIGYFAIQSIFNIAVTLNLVPTKGMTLPFISYGGSSLIAQAMLFGIYLNITRNDQKLGLKKNKIHVRI